MAKAFGLLALGAVALMAAGCSGAAPSPASTAVPMGGNTFGFWVFDAASIKDAVKQVDARTGMQTRVPSNVPPGFALKSVSEGRTAPADPNKREVLDYYSTSFTPPVSGAISTTEPHIQVTELPVVATEERPSTAVDLGLPGCSAISVNLSAAEKAVAGSGGIFEITCKGRTWNVT
ncbi:MAG TPA: hypothetical protein VN697_09415, partial [Tepidiformaceae bacterium]|nr:hypothetical protein [Tepidiformaceae bacterium]